MPSSAKVSVIVATRNRPKTLRATVDGISRQTHAPVELILVDDGSSPEHASANEQLARDANARYEYIPSSAARGSGPSYARNRGIELATGDLIAFCDDDDLWVDPDHLLESVELFAQHGDLDLVFANQESHLEGKIVVALRLPLLAEALNLGSERTGRPFTVSKENRFLGYFPHLNTAVFRRALLEQVGGFWEAVRYAEDLDLYVRSADAARRIMYRDKTVAVHNIPDESARANASTIPPPIRTGCSPSRISRSTSSSTAEAPKRSSTQSGWAATPIAAWHSAPAATDSIGAS